MLMALSLVQATEGITDEYWTYHRAHNLNRYQKQGGGLDHYGNWVCLDSYALLGERFGWDTYRVLQEKYFNDAELRKTSGDKRYGNRLENTLSNLMVHEQVWHLGIGVQQTGEGQHLRPL